MIDNVPSEFGDAKLKSKSIVCTYTLYTFVLNVVFFSFGRDLWSPKTFVTNIPIEPFKLSTVLFSTLVRSNIEEKFQIAKRTSLICVWCTIKYVFSYMKH